MKRLIYTASVVSASPLKEDGSGFKDAMDENCWTPLNDSLAYIYRDDPFLKVVQFFFYFYTASFSDALTQLVYNLGGEN